MKALSDRRGKLIGPLIYDRRSTQDLRSMTEPRVSRKMCYLTSVLADALERPVLVVHALERPCGEDPLAQRLPADAHRILEALLRSGTESVDGNGEVHFDLGHGLGSYRSLWGSGIRFHMTTLLIDRAPYAPL